MAVCRIYLCTYRRHNLLPRAFKSLLAQTFTDWVCELHNDDPEDTFPKKLVEEIADTRISMCEHKHNLGPTRTFNLIFQEVSEQFVSLLEDDNWWEPSFLAKMIGVMEQFPTIHVAWANMHFWQEEPNGNWTDTGRNIWNRSETDPPELFDWGHPRQIFGALHSNGAMLVRAQFIKHYVIPEETPFTAAESFRERTYVFPILFVPQVYANFAITRNTSRSDSRASWGQMQTLLAASFFKHVPVKEKTLHQIWHEARSQVPKSTGTLFFVALIFPECRQLIKHATIIDWVFFIGFCIKRPVTAFQIFQSVAFNPKLWDFLDQQTARVTEQAQQRGFRGI
ncbi:MAG: glycosyltransferase [Stigonema ocellatum SAG 48.90 = DSM 106950]|nr:glycosyltransferase [Stigonema ocellatum SAG 48.90 = DSM 106950]